jgi:hypothetical protein
MDRIRDIDFTNISTKLATDQMNKRFAKQYQNFVEMANVLLDAPGRISDLYTLPYIENCQNKRDVLIAILV